MTEAIKINQNDGKTTNIMTGGETEIDFDFPIYAATHVTVYETDTNGDITLLVKDTDYTVPAGSVNVQAGGTIDLDGTQYPSGATAGHVFTVYQSAPEARTTDFNQAGDFFADTLNQELDLITQQIQQLRRDLSRAPLAPVDTTLTSLSLPDPTDGYGFVWDGVAGAIRNTTSSLASLEGDAETVAGIAADVTAVAAIDTEVTTVAGISGNITTVAGIAANVTTVAGISSNVTTVAGISANVTTVAGDSADIQILAPISADIQTLADIEDGTVATGAIQAVADVDTDVTAVAAIAANVTTVAGISANVTTVAGISANVTTVAGIAVDVSTVAAIASDVTAAANNIPLSNRSATTDPTVNDDSGDGYSEGSLWVNTSTNTVFFCADPTLGAAVWQSLAGSLSGLSDATIASVANNDFLVYQTGSNTWQNLTAANARTAMGLGTAATQNTGAFLQPSNNLTDVNSAATAFNNIKQAATTSATGVIEKATAAEVTAETSDKFPDAADLKSHKGVVKAWVQFDGTGTAAISEAYNVSSLTDNGTGDFTINLGITMASTDFGVVTSGNTVIDTVTTTSVEMRSFSSGGSLFNDDRTNMAIMGELA